MVPLLTMARDKESAAWIEVERVQTGVRLEKRMLKVLKAVAELKDMSLGDLLEGVVLHAFEGKTPFSAGDTQGDRAIQENLWDDVESVGQPPIKGG